MAVSGIVYVPDIIEHDVIDDTDIIELYKNGLYNAWKNIGTMSPRLIRLLFGETIAVERITFQLVGDQVFEDHHY